jgi:hypothetical protein
MKLRTYIGHLYVCVRGPSPGLYTTYICHTPYSYYDNCTHTVQRTQYNVHMHESNCPLASYGRKPRTHCNIAGEHGLFAWCCCHNYFVQPPVSPSAHSVNACTECPVNNPPRSSGIADALISVYMLISDAHLTAPDSGSDGCSGNIQQCELGYPSACFLT